jgi:hypothetical protein
MVLDSNEQKALADLKRKRDVVKGALTRVRTFVNKFDPSLQAVSLLEFRQEELPQINRKFEDIQSQIELLVDEEEESELERETFENEYFAIRSQIQELISLEKPHNSTAVNASFPAMNIHRAQLQPIPLHRFNGNISYKNGLHFLMYFERWYTMTIAILQHKSSSICNQVWKVQL